MANDSSQHDSVTNGNNSNNNQNVEQQIPGYRILAKLGAGSMAAVFKARQLSLNRNVAIKILPKKLSEDKEYVERFYSEGRAAAKLNHPNIVGALDVGEHKGYHYFIMEYVEGRTVDEILKEKGRYSDTEALDIIIQVARALEHAHNQGMIHRDVKPKNIMITTNGTAKLMDLGLARAADDVDAIKSETGRLFGTPYYISPEQVIGNKDVDFRCDIYSLGATLYHMVTGQVPFDAEDSKQVMIKHVKERPVSPDRINMDISFGLCKTILMMMAKKKEDRYGSTAEMIEELESIDFLLEVGEDKTPEIPVAEKGSKPRAPKPKTQKRSFKEQIQKHRAKNETEMPEPVVVEKRDYKTICLIAGLGVSLLLNLILILLLVFT